MFKRWCSSRKEAPARAESRIDHGSGCLSYNEGHGLWRREQGIERVGKGCLRMWILK